MSWYFSSCKQKSKVQIKIHVTESWHKKVALVLYTLLILLCLAHWQGSEMTVISLLKLLKPERRKRMWFHVFFLFSLTSSHNALSFRIIFFSSTWSWTTFANFKQPQKNSWPFFSPFTLQVPRSHTNSPHWSPYMSWKNSWENWFKIKAFSLWWSI